LRIYPSPAREGGFSLVEVLLTLSLVLGLAAATVVTFTGLDGKNALDEGADRLESMIRFARAEASNSGRQVRLVFDPSTNRPAAASSELRDIKVSWESDSTGHPGQFESMPNRGWNDSSINDLIGVEQLRPITPAAPKAPVKEPSFGGAASEPPRGAGPALAPQAGFETEESEMFSNAVRIPESLFITFYPDGSSDKAEIIVSSRREEDHRKMMLRVTGMLGSVTRKLLETDQFLRGAPGGLDGSGGLDQGGDGWAKPGPDSFGWLDSSQSPGGRPGVGALSSAAK